MRIKAFAALLTLSWATASLAQSAAPAPSPFKLEVHGIASMTMFAQDGNLAGGNGQIGYFPTAPATQPKSDSVMLGADARQTRFNFTVTGPAVMGGAIPKGVMELDWMGNFGSGNQGEVHLYPRLRLAYTELNWGADRFIFGQNHDLTAAMGPVSQAHIGAPYLLSSGQMGFRRPGIFYYHTFGDLKDAKSFKTEFALEVGRAQWADVGGVGNGAGANGCAGYVTSGNAVPLPTGTPATAGICAGEASGLPAVQARLAFAKGTSFSAFAAGHWNKIDRNGAGVTDSSTFAQGATFQPLDVMGGNAGFKGVMGPLTLAAAGYYGKNLSPLYGGFGTIMWPAKGDIKEYGGWGQIGFNLTKEFSAWYFLGVERIDDDDIKANGGYGATASGFSANREVNWNAMLQYRDGGYALALEWLQMRANYATGLSIVNQVALSANYYF